MPRDGSITTDSWPLQIVDSNGNVIHTFYENGAFESQSVSTGVGDITDQSDTSVSAIGQGNENLYSERLSQTAPATAKYYAYHAEVDATGRDSNDGDVTAMYAAASTTDQDVWAMNPLITIEDDGDGYAGTQSYAIEADVNTDVAGIGAGIGIFGIGSADAFAGINIARSENNWIEGVRVRDVSNWAYRYVDSDDSTIWGIQPSGNMDMGSAQIFNASVFKTAIDTDANYQVPLESSSVFQRHDFSVGGSSLFAIEAEGDGSGGISDSVINFRGTQISGVRSSGTALAAGDLRNGEIAMDESNGRLVWKDDSGSSYYVSGNAL